MVPDVSRYSGTSNLKFPPQVVVNADVCLQFASPASLGFISRSFIVSHTGEFPTPPKKKLLTAKDKLRYQDMMSVCLF